MYSVIYRLWGFGGIPRTNRENTVHLSDYIRVTVPATIAPMNFSYTDTSYERIDVIVKGHQGKEVHINTKHVNFPEKEWKQLLNSNQGDSLLFTVSIKQKGKWSTYKPFPMYISPHPIDYGLV